MKWSAKPFRATMQALPLLAALVLASCAAPASKSVEAAPAPVIATQTGMASWYGPGLHGRTTANGETFDQNMMSAAHRDWPMPSMVEVTNLENGRRIAVRVNDRGPFARGRIIDLSRAAARALDFEHDGEARVSIALLGPPPAAH